jgi:hypothetical protein
MHVIVHLHAKRLEHRQWWNQIVLPAGLGHRFGRHALDPYRIKANRLCSDRIPRTTGVENVRIPILYETYLQAITRPMQLEPPVINTLFP